jgi:hypothetical protein
MINLHAIITDIELLAGRTIFRNGFSFTALANVGNQANVFDAIVIRNPSDAQCFTPKLSYSDKTLQEHIDFINEHHLKKAVVIAEDISFLSQCPSLQYLQIIPADNARSFDYSPLYQLKYLAGLNCATEYGLHFSEATQIDYSHFPNIVDLDISGCGHRCTDRITSIQRLNVSRHPAKKLFQIVESPRLKSLNMTQCSIQSLDGISKAEALYELSLWHNRSLSDVSGLSSHNKSLRRLSIGSCPKITDFSFLKQFDNLEYLELVGSNSLPDLSFLLSLKSLKAFTFDMNVLDGDLTLCLNIPRVNLLRYRKHYNLTDADLPKAFTHDNF